MKKSTKYIVLTTVIIIIAAVIGFFIFRGDSGNPTLENPAYNSPQVEENSNVATVTFPEGFTVTQIAERLEENGVCSKADFLNAVNNPDETIVAELGIDNRDERIFLLEGYVFPDTYEFYKGESAASVLQRFIDNYRVKISESDKQRAAELGYTMDEIIRIASIIQEEAGRPEQDAKVSSVLHNRLNTGTKIECDVTIAYLEDFCEPYLQNGLTEENREKYNTYKCLALPAGPITNPGYSAIQAALYPEQTNYFFFVTDKDWNYYYAATWAEHVANCRTAEIPGY